jgi:hypothetical protein
LFDRNKKDFGTSLGLSARTLGAVLKLGTGFWELQVIGQLVWRDALQHQLAGIRVFAFVALQRNAQKSNPDGNHEAENDYGEDAPAKTQHFAVQLDFMSHESCFSDWKGRLATERFPLHCVSLNSVQYSNAAQYS